LPQFFELVKSWEKLPPPGLALAYFFRTKEPDNGIMKGDKKRISSEEFEALKTLRQR